MRLKAVLKGKCSFCLEGKIFHSFMGMNEHCPQCGIKFEREPGYFMMAIFLGYILSAAVVFPVLLIVYLTIKPTVIGYAIAGAITLMVATPWIFRYGRIFWLHLDEVLDPRRTEDDKMGRTPTPHGIDLMLKHEGEAADQWYQRQSGDTDSKT